KKSYDPVNGLQVAVPWESAGDNLHGIAQAYQDARVQFDFEPNGKKSTLIAKASGGQIGIPNVAADEWQIHANEIQKELLEHPRLNYVGDDDIRKVRNAVNNPVPGQDPSFGVNEDLLKVYHLMIKGTTHFATSQYVLRHTTNVSNDYSLNI